MDVTYSCVDDTAELPVTTVSEDCGATAKVRMATFDATGVAGTPFDDTGTCADADAEDDADCAGAAEIA